MTFSSVLLPLMGATTAALLLQGAALEESSSAPPSSASPSGLILQRFHDVLQTNARTYFGRDDEALRLAVEWHHSRLRAAAAGERQGAAAVPAAAAAGVEGEAVEYDSAPPLGSGTGTFVVLTSHRRAARAREVLSAALSRSSVLTAAHNREQGGCFFVHASAADVDALLLLPGGEESGAGEGKGGGRLFDGFVAVPPSLKLAPSLLDHGSIFDSLLSSGGEAGGGAATVPGVVDEFLGDRAAGASPVPIGVSRSGLKERLGTSPGKALRRNSGGEGLVVLLLSPDSVDGDLALAERWRRDWSSASLDLHSLSYWSASDGHRARFHREVEEEATKAAFLANEWSVAARTVHALAERLGGVSPSEACGWNDIRVAAEGRGRSLSSGWITLRDIGHLLPGRSPDKSDSGSKSSGNGRGGASDQAGPGGQETINTETEKMACLMGLISFLAARPEVVRVSALPRAELMNAVAGRIVQGGSATSEPMWDRGVDGSGEVIQVVDSGVAQGSCYFRNSATTLGPEHGYLRDSDGTLGAGDFQYDLSQRKVVQYIEGTQGSGIFTDDDSDGHGSHVAGSVAGSIYSGWEGPAACPGGVAGATENQTAVSCVGKCLAPSVLESFVGDNTFDLDALCPEYDCDVYFENSCFSDDRSQTLEESKGVAPAAKLAILDLGTSESLDQVLGGTMWETAAGTGARLHSASWGFLDEPCTVDDSSVSFDAWAFENPEHLLVFAAGNSGDDLSGCSIISPAVSKNGLAVGSSMSGTTRLTTGDLDEVSGFSSKGPTSDGRIKPDVLAPGHYIFSASNGGDGSCQLDANSGTSMSCPIAAGAAALVRQYVGGGFYSDDLNARGLCMASDPAWSCDTFSPSGALVKALLIHGADSMGGGTDPDGERGFGRINLEPALPFEGEGVWALYVEDADGSTTSAGQVEALAVEERTFAVSQEDAATAVAGGSSTGPGGIRATLVWMDPPATASSVVQLVHDLDLFLEGPDGTTWTMLGKCSGDQASCSLDNRNNVERIVVPASDVIAGTWTVRVSASNGLVEGGPQSYALAVSLPISTGAGTAAPAATTPAPANLDSALPATSQPSAAKLDTGVPTTIQPSAGGLGTAVPTTLQPSAANLETALPTAVQPPTGDLDTTAQPSGQPSTPAPVIVIASPGGGPGDSSSSSQIIADEGGSTHSPVSSDGGDDGDGARGIGGTPSPSPESEVEGSGASGAARSAGGARGVFVGGICGVWGVAVAAGALLATAAVGGGGAPW